MRSGIIAQKLGMTRIFTDAGDHVPVTVLKVEGCQVVAHRTQDKNGYTGAAARHRPRQGQERAESRARALCGGQCRAEDEARRIPRHRGTSFIPVGAEITADHFLVGQFVDVTGVTIGKGLPAR